MHTFSVFKVELHLAFETRLIWMVNCFKDFLILRFVVGMYEMIFSKF